MQRIKWDTPKFIALLIAIVCPVGITTADTLTFKRIEIDAQPPQNPWVKNGGRL